MLGREPALWMGLVGAVVALGIGFGLPVTPVQFGLIMAAVAAILAVVTRSQVTSTPQVDALIKTAVNVPAGTSVEKVKEIQAAKDSV